MPLNRSLIDPTKTDFHTILNNLQVLSLREFNEFLESEKFKNQIKARCLPEGYRRFMTFARSIKKDIIKREDDVDAYKKSKAASCSQNPNTNQWVVRPEYRIQYEEKTKLRTFLEATIISDCDLVSLTTDYQGYPKGTIGIIRDIHYYSASYTVELRPYDSNGNQLWRELRTVPWNLLKLEEQWDDTTEKFIPVAEASDIRPLWTRYNLKETGETTNTFLEYRYDSTLLERSVPKSSGVTENPRVEERTV